MPHRHESLPRADFLFRILSTSMPPLAVTANISERPAVELATMVADGAEEEHLFTEIRNADATTRMTALLLAHEMQRVGRALATLTVAAQFVSDDPNIWLRDTIAAAPLPPTPEQPS